MEAQFQPELDRQIEMSKKPQHIHGRIQRNSPARFDKDADYVLVSTGYIGDETVPTSPEDRFVSIQADGDKPAVFRRDYLSRKVFLNEGKQHDMWVGEWAPVPQMVVSFLEVYFSVNKVDVPSDGKPTDAMVESIAKAVCSGSRSRAVSPLRRTRPRR